MRLRQWPLERRLLLVLCQWQLLDLSASDCHFVVNFHHAPPIAQNPERLIDRSFQTSHHRVNHNRIDLLSPVREEMGMNVTSSSTTT